MMVTSIFSFSHNVFKTVFARVIRKRGQVLKGYFYPKKESLEIKLKKGKMMLTRIFSFHLFFQTFLKMIFTILASFSIFSSTGQRPASYCHGIVSVIRPFICLFVCQCVCKLFLQKLLLKTIDWICTFHRNVP